MERDRREFLRNAGIVMSVAIAGEVLYLSPASARAAGLPYQVLSAQQVTTLEVLTDALVPGAGKAGIAQYIDKQLAASHDESMLMLKYLGVPQSGFTAFYRGGLDSAARYANLRFRKPWPDLDADQAETLLTDIASGQVEGWDGPPSPFFHFVIRSDACDVVYGTEAGFARVDIPYMAHIPPPEPW